MADETRKGPAMKRDPGVEPKAGDVLTVPGITREVTERIGKRGGTVEFDQQDFAGVHYYCTLTLRTWRKWAKNAEVIHCAE